MDPIPYIDPEKIARAKDVMRRQGEAQEIPADIEPYGPQRAERLAGINRRRKLHGLAPFENDEEGKPELTESRRRRSEEFWARESRKRARERTSRGSGVSLGR